MAETSGSGGYSAGAAALRERIAAMERRIDRMETTIDVMVKAQTEASITTASDARAWAKIRNMGYIAMGGLLLLIQLLKGASIADTLAQLRALLVPGSSSP